MKQLTKSITEYMAEIGRRGGRARTEAKQIAARLNGQRGGRPKTKTTKQGGTK
jgi:hypothetical protein